MKRPLVLAASSRCVEQARAFGISRPLENVVEEAIIRGDLPSASVRREWPVSLGDGLVAVCSKVRTQSGRTGWLVRRLDQEAA